MNTQKNPDCACQNCNHERCACKAEATAGCQCAPRCGCAPKCACNGCGCCNRPA